MQPSAFRTIFLAAFAAMLTLLSATPAGAVPLYASQTGQKCASCHFGGNFHELTASGREFKLLGYVDGERERIPVSAMLQASMTKISSYNGSDASQFPRDGGLVAQQVSLFSGGKVTDNIGAFVQWTYDGVAHHSNLDNTDIRYANKTKVGDKALIYGLSLNNNPTVQDVFNTVPAWGFPYASPAGGTPAMTPAAGTLIDGGLAQLVAGLNAYVDWNDSLYAEIGGYKTADGVFSFMRAGQDTAANRYVIGGTSPYWRLALHGDSGAHHWMVGTYGMVADIYSDPTDATSPTNRFKDIALDGQYQYASDKNRWSVQTTWIHEKADWNAATIGNGVDNSSDTLDTFRIKGSYFYNNQVGGTVGVFSTTGSQDAPHYSGSANGSPNSRGYIVEADYLPISNVKLAAQYTGYTKFDGASSNYDGSGRNARDNNTLYLLGWLLF